MVSRRPAGSGTARPAAPAHVVADVTRPAEFAGALDRAVAERGPITLALAYQPFAPAQSWRLLADRTAGLLVALLVSAHAAEDGPAAPLAAGRQGGATVVHVLLGWHRDADGVRWHTPQEVSAATIRAVDERAGRVLGAVRPWEERPGR